MLKSRIIPCLLIKDKGLVKTVNFAQSKYIGDPLNAVKIFNEKQVDELLVLDIDATTKGSELNYELISKLAMECRMPLCYGGGVISVDQVERLIELGVEKVAISNGFISSPEMVYEVAKKVGSQSVAVVLDVKRTGFFSKQYRVFTHNGSVPAKYSVSDLIEKAHDFGAGEIIINSIDDDGVLGGYDHSLIEMVKRSVKIPMTILGGAGSYQDMSDVVSKFGIIGVAAGSVFTLKGKYRAVLIQYPNEVEKMKILTGSNIQ